MSITKNNSPAYKLYVNEQFIKPFIDYIPDYFNINCDNAEEELISTMCWYFSDKICEKFDFYKIKENYLHNLKNLSPNKDYVQAHKLIEREQTKLETYGRIKYYIDKLDSHDCLSIDILVYLYLIYTKLNKKSIKDITESKMYKYLRLAYSYETHIDINNYVTHSLSQLSKDLQESVENLFYDDKSQYISSLDNAGNLILYSYLGEEENKIPLSQEEIEEYTYIEDEPYEKDVFVGERLFKQELRQEMLTQPNGMIF